MHKGKIVIFQEIRIISVNRNALALLLFQFLGKIFPLVALPLSVCLFTAEELGAFGAFVATAAIFSSLANLSYEHTIQTAKTEDQITLGVITCLGSTICVSLFLLFLSTLAFLIWPHTFVLLIAPYTICRALNILGTNILIRKEFAKKVGRLRFFESFLCQGSMLAFGYVGFGISGLIASSFLSLLPTFFFSLPLLRPLLKRKIGKDILLFIKEHKRFPLLVAPAQLLTHTTNHLHTLIANTLFPFSLTGDLFLAQRVLQTPLPILDPIAALFLKELSAKPDAKTQVPLWRSGIILYGAAIFSATFLLGGLLLIVPLSGRFLSFCQFLFYLFPAYALSYGVKLLTPLALHQGKQKFLFYYALIGNLITLSIGGVSWYIEASLLTYVILFTLSHSLLCILWTVLFFKQAPRTPLSTIKRQLACG